MKALFSLIKNLILLPVKIILFLLTLPLKAIKAVFAILKLILKIVKSPLIIVLGLAGAAAFVLGCEDRRKKVLGMLGL